MHAHSRLLAALTVGLSAIAPSAQPASAQIVNRPADPKAALPAKATPFRIAATAPAKPLAQNRAAANNNQGQQSDRDPAQQSQNDNGQQNQRDDGQAGQKNDGQQSQKDDGPQNQNNSAQQGKNVAVPAASGPGAQLVPPRATLRARPSVRVPPQTTPVTRGQISPAKPSL